MGTLRLTQISLYPVEETLLVEDMPALEYLAHLLILCQVFKTDNAVAIVLILGYVLFIVRLMGIELQKFPRFLLRLLSLRQPSRRIILIIGYIIRYLNLILMHLVLLPLPGRGRGRLEMLRWWDKVESNVARVHIVMGQRTTQSSFPISMV